MSLMKSSIACQKARLLAALASLNNGHNSDLCAYCVDVKSSKQTKREEKTEKLFPKE
jgi:hypothetical protein